MGILGTICTAIVLAVCAVCMSLEPIRIETRNGERGLVKHHNKPIIGFEPPLDVEYSDIGVETK
jgi:hypothetical protein